MRVFSKKRNFNQTNRFMDELEEIVCSSGSFGDLSVVGGDWDKCSSKSNGESYDGFINFTEGFLVREAYWTPILDEELYFVGVDAASAANAKKVQKIADALSNEDFVLEEFFAENIQDENSDWYGFVDSVDELKEYYYNSNNQTDSTWIDIDDYLRSWFDETPAFVGVSVLLHEKNGHKTCEVLSYLNDDLGYGRENVGDWAGKNIIDENYGNHYIYENEFEWQDEEDLKNKLPSEMEKAYATLNL